MEQKRLNEWEKTVDIAEASPLTANLPTTYPLGMSFHEPIDNGQTRIWVRVKVVAGKAGARWAYWSNKENHDVIADSIFNGDQPHFVGMLGVPYSGKNPGEPALMAWVLIEPRLIPAPEIRHYEEKPKERYERSREVYDVDTGESRPVHPLGNGVVKDGEV